MPRSVPRGRVLAALVIGAETAALFLAYYGLGLQDRIVSLEQSSVVQAVALQVLVIVRSLLPVWLLQSLSTFTSTLGLTQGLHDVVIMGASLPSSAGFSGLGGAIMAPAYFAVRRMLRPVPRPRAQRFRAIHWRVRPAKAETPATSLAVPTAAT